MLKSYNQLMVVNSTFFREPDFLWSNFIFEHEWVTEENFDWFFYGLTVLQ